MRHIKGFNEAMNSHEMLKLGIKELCDSYLAYLSDEYDLSVYDVNRDVNVHNAVLDTVICNKEINPRKYINIRISNGGEYFYWSEVSDHLIPFLSILSETYVMDNDKPGYTTSGNVIIKQKSWMGATYKNYKVSDILNDKIVEYREMREIIIQIR